MYINDVEYGILLLIQDEDMEEIADFFFHDFQEFNAFVRENEWRYQDCYFEYSIVEVIDGNPEDYSWTAAIDFLEIDEEEAEEIIADFLHWMKEDQKIFKEVNDRTMFRTKEADPSDPQAKIQWKKEYTYVCPYCMYDLDGCQCSSYPYQLIQIDTKILPVIRMLNKKGYRTVSCCAGHMIKKADSSHCIYIGFAEKYDFAVPYPYGGIFTQEGILRYEFPENAEGEEGDFIEMIQEEILMDLLEWAESLPEKKEKG